MITRKLGILAGLAIMLTSWTLGAQEGPAKAMVGDWISMKMSGKGFYITSKKTVISKDDTTATIKVETSFGGKDLPAQEEKFPLSHFGDPTKMNANPSKSKLEKLKAGKETLTVKGKKIDCEWMEMKHTAGDGSDAGVAKLWVSRDIPIHGLVKMETEVMGQKMTMELFDYGRGK